METLVGTIRLVILRKAYVRSKGFRAADDDDDYDRVRLNLQQTDSALSRLATTNQSRGYVSSDTMYFSNGDKVQNVSVILATLPSTVISVWIISFLPLYVEPFVCYMLLDIGFSSSQW